MPTLSRLLGAVVAAAAALLPATAALAPASSAAPGSVVSEGAASAETSTRCSPGVGDGRKTVLLVHGTGSTAEEAWSWNWERTPCHGLRLLHR